MKRTLLHRYAFLVKNLRGVLAALPDDQLGEYAAWLARRFRYRDLGVPPGLVALQPEAFRGRLGGNPFHELRYPTRRVATAAERLLALLERETQAPRVVLEAMLLASAYAAPVLATPAALEALEPLIVHRVYSRGKLDAKSARLHLRIVDYTVLDAYVPSIEEFVEYARAGRRPEELREARRARAEKDSRRYWRVSADAGETLIAYLDYASLALREPSLAQLLCGEEERVLTAMLAAFNLGMVEKAP